MRALGGKVLRVAAGGLTIALALWASAALWIDGPASRPMAGALAVDGLDLFVSYWGPTLYAHTILSWDFGDSPPLAVSIETRKEKGESYSAVRGFFRQFELVYVLADERDVVRLRTSFRGERVFLCRHGAGEGLRGPPGLLALHPGGPAGARGAEAVDCKARGRAREGRGRRG